MIQGKNLLPALLMLLSALCCCHGHPAEHRASITASLEGTVTERQVPAGDPCLQAADSIVRTIGEPLRLIVTEDTVDGIRNGDHIEIILPEKTTATTPSGETVTYDRMLIKLNGDSPAFIVCLGVRQYRTPAYINTSGTGYLERMKEAVLTEKPKEK